MVICGELSQKVYQMNNEMSSIREIANDRIVQWCNMSLNECMSTCRQAHSQYYKLAEYPTNMFLEYNKASFEKCSHIGLWWRWCVHTLGSAFAIPGYNDIPFRMGYSERLLS